MNRRRRSRRRFRFDRVVAVDGAVSDRVSRRNPGM